MFGSLILKTADKYLTDGDIKELGLNSNPGVFIFKTENSIIEVSLHGTTCGINSEDLDLLKEQLIEGNFKINEFNFIAAKPEKEGNHSIDYDLSSARKVLISINNSKAKEVFTEGDKRKF